MYLEDRIDVYIQNSIKENKRGVNAEQNYKKSSESNLVNIDDVNILDCD